jgi:hypothetical protein
MVAVGKKETVPRAIGSARPAPQRQPQQPVPPGAPNAPQLPAHAACLAPTRVGRINDATALRLCLPRSYTLTPDAGLCLQIFALGAREARQPPRCLRRYSRRGLPASRRCPRATRVRARVVRAELDGLEGESWLWPRLCRPIHLRINPKPSCPPPVTLVAPEVGCGVGLVARRDHQHVARLAPRLAPRGLSPPLAPRTCVHATRLESNRGLRGSLEENLVPDRTFSVVLVARRGERVLRLPSACTRDNEDSSKSCSGRGAHRQSAGQRPLSSSH